LSPRCGTCGQIIGVYEPVICVIDGVPYRTARAHDPDLLGRAAACYHDACRDLIAFDPE
jgi:hypothetical protein